MFCIVSLIYFLEQAATMPSFRNPVPATAACYEHPFSSSAASHSDQSLNIHGSSSTFNVYNYYSSGRGGTVHSSKVSSAYVTPGQSVTSPPFKMSGRLSRHPSKALSCRSPSPQLSTPLVARSPDLVAPSPQPSTPLVARSPDLVAETAEDVTESD